MRKKLFTLSLVTAIAAATLTGCGNSGDTDPIIDKEPTNIETTQDVTDDTNVDRDNDSDNTIYGDEVGSTSEESETDTDSTSTEDKIDELEQKVEDLEEQNKDLEEQVEDLKKDDTTEESTEEKKPAQPTPKIVGVHNVSIPANTDWNTFIEELVKGVSGAGKVVPITENVNLREPGAYIVFWSSDGVIQCSCTVFVEEPTAVK